MLASGELNAYITLQRKTVVQDDINGQIDVWEACGEPLWARIDAVTGRESYVADQIKSVVALRVQVRQPGPAVDATMRLNWQGAILSIEAVLPHPDRDRLILLCSQGANHG